MNEWMKTKSFKHKQKTMLNVNEKKTNNYINSKYCLMNKDLNYNYIEDDWNNFLQPGYHYYYI